MYLFLCIFKVPQEAQKAVNVRGFPPEPARQQPGDVLRGAGSAAVEARLPARAAAHESGDERAQRGAGTVRGVREPAAQQDTQQ